MYEKHKEKEASTKALQIPGDADDEASATSRVDSEHSDGEDSSTGNTIPKATEGDSASGDLANRFPRPDQKWNNPFAIRSEEEALTYEMLGDQGTNALPFPKITCR